MFKKLLTPLALFLLIIPAASPYLWGVGESVPRTNDLLPHLYRTFALAQAVDWAGMWPRWSPELVHGYGYPVFNYFPLLSHWFINLFHQLGLPLTTAYRTAVLGHFYITALSSYALGMTLFRSRWSGWVVALLYVYSPYLLYDAHVRGSPPESQGLALLPLLVLGLWHLTERRGGEEERKGGREAVAPRPSPLALHVPWIILTSLTYAAIILSHHPVALQMSVPLGLWLLLRAGWPREGDTRPWFTRLWQTLWPPAVALLLGGLLTAFFSLPALLEIGYTRAEVSISQGYTYENNFLPLVELFTWPRFPADPAFINPPVRRALPLVGLAWVLVGLLWQWRGWRRDDKQTPVSWLLILLLSVFLMIPASRWVWDVLPLLKFTLYPWRLLGMASLAIAILGGQMVQGARFKIHHSPFTIHHLQFLSLTLLTLLASTPWLFPPREPMPESPTQADVSGSEMPPYFIGTTTLGEFLPVAVQELPDTAVLKEQLINHNPDRLLPQEGLVATRTQPNPLDVRYEVTAVEPLTLTYQQFYFPGWQAAVNGQSIDITPSVPHGLISLPIPAGQHRVQIWLGNTAVQTGATWLTAVVFVGLLMLGGWSFFNRRERGGRGEKSAPSPPPRFILSESVQLLLLGALVVTLWGAVVLIDSPLRRDTLQENGIIGLPQMTPLDYAGELRLLTFTQSANEITAVETVQLDTYWQPQKNIGLDYAIGVQIIDEQGLNWLGRDPTRPLDWRFIAGREVWPLDKYRVESHEMVLLDGTPPGDYRFLVGLVRRDTGQTVAAHELGQLMVTAPGRGDAPLPDGFNQIDITSGGMTLLGSQLDRPSARPGDPLRLATLWQIDDANPSTTSFTLSLITANGDTLNSRQVDISQNYAANQWQTGDRLRRDLLLRLPADLPDGQHLWQASWGESTAVIGQLQINAPERTFTPPPLDITINETLGDTATLLGLVEAPQPTTDGLLPVTLVWRGENTAVVSYRVFVQLLNEAGELVAQADGEPAQWSRPTTGWLLGEIVLDSHALPLPADLPAGEYRLIAGLYDAATGERLGTGHGRDFILLDTITIE